MVRHQPGPMVLVPAIMTVVAIGCSSAEGDTAVSATQDEAPTLSGRVVNVEVTPVELSEFTSFIRVTGEVEAINDVTIAAEETGRIERFLVEKGSRVAAGQAIAQLEADLLRAQVDEARAAAQLAADEFERQRQLWEEDGVGTELLFIQRKAQVDIAAARLKQLETRLARTTIRAPVAGVFDEKYLDEGEMAVTGSPVARVVSIGRVKVTAGIPERFARFVRRGAEARVTLDVFPGEVFVGRTSFVGSTVDPSNRTFPIEVMLSNPGSMVKPAMVANVEVQRDQLADVIVVPQQVVLRSADGYKVFVVDDRGDRQIAAARAVTLGPSAGNAVVIEEGLEVGDRLVTVGQQLVDDQSMVRIVNRDEAASEGGRN